MFIITQSVEHKVHKLGGSSLVSVETTKNLLSVMPVRKRFSRFSPLSFSQEKRAIGSYYNLAVCDIEIALVVVMKTFALRNPN